MKITTTRIHSELPIFRLNQGTQAYIYTPGHAYRLTPAEADRLQGFFVSGKPLQPSLARLTSVLIDQARQAQRAWETLAEAPYAPVCLTVYLSNRCNLGCSYCFAAPARMKDDSDGRRLRQGHDRDAAVPVIRADTVEGSAQVVADHCAKSGKPLTVVFHGGGEPTLHWELLQRLVALTRRVAAMHGIDWWGYIATHGVLSENKAEWLARHFNLLGLSCDGPPAIQNAQRPTARGAATARIVERTARAFIRIGTPFTVRATITPEIVHQQSEIVRYLHEKLRARVIRFEPVYRIAGDPRPTFRVEDAEPFATAFLAAQRSALTAGVDLSLSGVRPDEIHGPYCHMLREVLQITPDGGVSACFLYTGGQDAKAMALALAQHNPDSQRFILNEDRIAALRQRALEIPARCEPCVNLYHCARDCPDACPLLGEREHEYSKAGGFRCHLYQRLGEYWICQRAQPLVR